MIDLHSHILPGLDDGARDLDDALALARAALDDGIDTIAATPHVRDDYPTTPEKMEQQFHVVCDALAREEIDVTLLPGGELALDAIPRMDDTTLRRFGLGGNPNVILIETPYVGFPAELGTTIRHLRERKIRPVIAHPERNPDVQADPERIEPLVRAGAVIQITAASLDGRLGRRIRETATQLLELELVHTVASDAHTPDIRAVGLSEAARTVGDKLAHWLTEDVPDSLLRGLQFTTRPKYAPPRRFFRR